VFLSTRGEAVRRPGATMVRVRFGDGRRAPEPAVVSSIGRGICVLVGIGRDDTPRRTRRGGAVENHIECSDTLPGVFFPQRNQFKL